MGRDGVHTKGQAVPEPGGHTAGKGRGTSQGRLQSAKHGLCVTQPFEGVKLPAVKVQDLQGQCT